MTTFRLSPNPGPSVVMLFNSLKYALFLPIVFALFWATPQKYRVWILLVASYVFYMSWRPGFILLIIGLTLANYYIGFAIHKAEAVKQKKLWLTLSVVINLVTLAFFKYAYFLNDCLTTALKPLGLPPTHLPFEIILPLGISFFVFEFIHYTTDVYRGSEPIKSFPAFALFASFFPTQIAGPIKRFQDFIPQFLAESKLTVATFDSAVSLILLGLFKKVLIADNLSFFVQGGFGNAGLFSGTDLWLFTYAFAFQIYFDFSGYTDIARGSAMLFGYKVPINFNLPYLARNISEFWHRWHISLSTWLRDYLFIPLGGSRCGRLKVHRNLLITMTLGGLWHGAAVHYLIWGMFHGALLIVHREFQALKNAANFGWLKNAVASKPGTILSGLLTFHAVCIGWVFFRAETNAVAFQMIRKMFTFAPVFCDSKMVSAVLPTINYPLIYPSIFLLLPILAVAHIVMGWLNTTTYVARTPKIAKAVWVCTMIFLVMVFSPDKSPRFIYFQF